MTDNVVKTVQGNVRGLSVDGVVAFKGIHYAAPPFGSNRFQPPQPSAAPTVARTPSPITPRW